MERYSETHRDAALIILQHELSTFSYDGLIQLHEDLQAHNVIRGSWAGCVLSYRNGAACSARRDLNNNARNAFTILWDNNWLSEEEVLPYVEREIEMRVHYEKLEMAHV